MYNLSSENISFNVISKEREWVCLCMCVRERETENEKERKRDRNRERKRERDRDREPLISDSMLSERLVCFTYYTLVENAEMTVRYTKVLF